MSEISIDPDVCKRDGLCAKTCMRSIFQQEEKGTIPKLVEPECCYDCGQCVAICPHDAISHSKYPKGTVTPVKSENIPSYDQVLELIHSRRSKRLFKKTEVEKDAIEKVLEAARFAPSAHNEQTTEFIVIRDKKTIREIATLTAGFLGKIAEQVQNPIARIFMRLFYGFDRRGMATLVKHAPELKGLVSLFNSGTDWILRDPPALILFCADSARGFSGENAHLAIQNATLAAETVGLGCYYVGFVTLACGRDNSIPKLLSLPETHKVYGTLAIGYPQLKFKKWPERNPAKVTWVDPD